MGAVNMVFAIRSTIAQLFEAVMRFIRCKSLSADARKTVETGTGLIIGIAWWVEPNRPTNQE